MRVDDPTTHDEGPARPVEIEGAAHRPAASDRRRYRLRSRWIYTGVGIFMGLAVLYGFDLVNSIGRVPRGTEVAGIDVGGMRTADAEMLLVSELGPRVDDEVDLRAGVVSTTLDPQAVGLSVDWQATLDRAGEQPLNPFTRLFSLFWTREVGIASVIPDERLTNFLERLALQADFEPREGAIWFDRDEVRSAIPLDGQRLEIEKSRDAVLEHWLDDDGVDLPVSTRPRAAPTSPRLIRRGRTRRLRAYCWPRDCAPTAPSPPTTVYPHAGPAAARSAAREPGRA